MTPLVCTLPNALVLCPLWGLENSETSVNYSENRAHTESETRKTGFPSLYRVSKNRDCLMRKIQVPRYCFSESYTGNISASKNQKMSPFLIF